MAQPSRAQRKAALKAQRNWQKQENKGWNPWCFQPYIPTPKSLDRYTTEKTLLNKMRKIMEMRPRRYAVEHPPRMALV